MMLIRGVWIQQKSRFWWFFAEIYMWISIYNLHFNVVLSKYASLLSLKYIVEGHLAFTVVLAINLIINIKTQNDMAIWYYLAHFTASNIHNSNFHRASYPGAFRKLNNCEIAGMIVHILFIYFANFIPHSIFFIFQLQKSSLVLPHHLQIDVNVTITIIMKCKLV